MKTKACSSLFLVCLLTVQSQSILNNSSFPSGRLLIPVSLGFVGPELGQLVAIRQFRFSLSQTLNKPSINHALKQMNG